MTTSSDTAQRGSEARAVRFGSDSRTSGRCRPGSDGFALRWSTGNRSGRRQPAQVGQPRAQHVHPLLIAGRVVNPGLGHFNRLPGCRFGRTGYPHCLHRGRSRYGLP